ncbi:unnamed protein product [Orchesella dallaii]|uniref:Ig-like domain-containing protein n=1 Tax=Orchesella dallaii TaxID=48710 RepID=A0ABP1RXT1_9HEXA
MVSQAEILGNPELHLKSGSDINLTCIVRQTPEPPTYIYWYHGRRVINYSQRGGKPLLIMLSFTFTMTYARGSER